MPRSGPGSVISLPPARIWPDVGCEKPAMALSRVDLPQPDGPSRQMNSPLAISRLMSFRAMTSAPPVVKIY
jgi:hypothetical protein